MRLGPQAAVRLARPRKRTSRALSGARMFPPYASGPTQTRDSHRLQAGALGGGADVDGGAYPRFRLVATRDIACEVRCGASIHERDGAPAEARTGHTGTIAPRVPLRPQNHGIQLRSRYLEVVAQARVARIHQFTEFRRIGTLERACRRDGARILRHHVTRAPRDDRIETGRARVE